MQPENDHLVFSRIERAEAQHHLELDATLLRDVRAEEARVRVRMRMLEGEIAGAREAIVEKERAIAAAQTRVEAMNVKLNRLVAHEERLRDDHAHWQNQATG